MHRTHKADRVKGDREKGGERQEKRGGRKEIGEEGEKGRKERREGRKDKRKGEKDERGGKREKGTPCPPRPPHKCVALSKTKGHLSKLQKILTLKVSV